MLIENYLPRNVNIKICKLRKNLFIDFFNFYETINVIITIHEIHIELEIVSSTHKSEKIKTDLLNVIPLISKSLTKSFNIKANINPLISALLRDHI